MKFKDIEVGKFFIFLPDRKYKNLGACLYRKLNDTNMMNMPSGTIMTEDDSIKDTEVLEVYVV